MTRNILIIGYSIYDDILEILVGVCDSQEESVEQFSRSMKRITKTQKTLDMMVTLGFLEK